MAVVRRTLTEIWELAVMTLVGVTLTALVVGKIFLSLGIAAILALMVVVRLATTTVEWPNSEVVAMRERVEQLLPPPPTSSFVHATITTHYDGDRWRCIEYKTEASHQDTHAYYERAKQVMRWGANDGIGFDGPYLVQQALVAKDVTVTVTPWIEGAPGVPGAFVAASPLTRVSVCYSYETWAWPETRNWPTRPRRPVVTVPWPDPAVVEMRERVERTYPPDPAWSFSGATLTRHPDGWRQICITYRTGVGESAVRAHYQRAHRSAQISSSPGTPWLGKASVRATDGMVTVCPF